MSDLLTDNTPCANIHYYTTNNKEKLLDNDFSRLRCSIDKTPNDMWVSEKDD
jgi:hypothetical protein